MKDNGTSQKTTRPKYSPLLKDQALERAAKDGVDKATFFL
jgi:hypothetical protein